MFTGFTCEGTGSRREDKSWVPGTLHFMEDISRGCLTEAPFPESRPLLKDNGSENCKSRPEDLVNSDKGGFQGCRFDTCHRKAHCAGHGRRSGHREQSLRYNQSPDRREIGEGDGPHEQGAENYGIYPAIARRLKSVSTYDWGGAQLQGYIPSNGPVGQFVHSKKFAVVQYLYLLRIPSNVYHATNDLINVKLY